MTRIPGIFATGGAIAVLIACSALLDAGVRSPASVIDQRIMEPVQRVVTPTSDSDNLPDLVDAACPAIVKLVQPPGKREQTESTGGIVISARGTILTASHGLQHGDLVDVAFHDGDVRPGRVTVVHDLSGLAIVQVEAQDLKLLSFDDTDLPRVGRWGFTLFSPAGRGCTVRTGVVIQDFTSAADGPRGWIDISADQRAVGLPFIGHDGRVIGFSTSLDGGAARFLPGTIVSRIAGAMARNGKGPAAPYGLIADQPGPVMARRLHAGRQRGAVVMLVVPGSPAARAGVVAGDIILTAGSAPIAAPSEFERALTAAADSIELTIQRRGRPLTILLER